MTTQPTDQLARVASQIAYCRERSPLYRTALADLPPDIGFDSIGDFAAAVPPITKAEIIANQQADPPYGDLLAAEPREIVRNYAYPVGQVLAWTARDQDTLERMYADGLAVSGLGPDDVVDITFQFGWVVAGTIWDAGARRLGAAVVPGGAGESARHALNLARLGVTSLIGFSTFLERIAESARESGIDPATDLAIRHLLIVGEWHGSDAKRQLSDTYGGAIVREAYGTGETGLVAAECEAGDGSMHLHPDVVVEVRDSAGDLVADGEGGEVYITPLGVEGMPILRFRTGDVTSGFTTVPCSCGRATPRIGPIVGRTSDLLRVKGSFLSRQLLQSVVDELEVEAGAFHVEVARPRGMDEIAIRIEVDDAPDGLGDDLSRRIKERAGVTASVSPVPTGSLDSDASWFDDRRTDD